MHNRIIVERNVSIPMRDGVVLKGDVYRPDTDRPVPAVLTRFPYNKDVLGLKQWCLEPVRAAEEGYAVVFQDTRGRFQSEGEFQPFIHEAQDGFDTVEWVAAQPWCTGSVGMIGASYFGSTQWWAAVEQPPHLQAILPIWTPSGFYECFSYPGGAFAHGSSGRWP